jgi:hypothetical protein
MTPADAESEAKRQELGPLASEPDPDDYDPMREPFWSFPMAVAWIVYRTQDAVRNWWDEYRNQFSVWRYQEWRVGPDGPHSSGALSRESSKCNARSIADGRCEARPGRSHERRRGNQRALAPLFKAEFWRSQASMKTPAGRVPIPAEQWDGLAWFEQRERNVIRARPAPGCNTQCYRDVIVPAEAIREGQVNAQSDATNPDAAGGGRLHAALLRSTVDRHRRWVAQL